MEDRISAKSPFSFGEGSVQAFSEPEVGIDDPAKKFFESEKESLENSKEESEPSSLLTTKYEKEKSASSSNFGSTVVFTFLFGLAIGVVLAMLLVSGTLSLSNQEVRHFFQTFKF